MKCWIDGRSSTDIYHMILYFLNDYKDVIKTQRDVYDIYRRLSNNDETNDIVEDFIYGDRYKNLRNEFE
jgi:hypothetical protein